MTTKRKLFFQLGRAGDILNVLPLAWKHHATTGEKPFFMVAEEFAGILEGVSYVEPVVWHGLFERTPGAMYQARQLTDNITVCQIYGLGVSGMQRCTSFARESWFKAGAVDAWGSLPLVIDRRDAARERALIDRVVGSLGRKPVVLAALAGKSSPFPFARPLIKALRETLEPVGFQVVDLSAVRAERFHDLLGLFEVAHSLVTIDTGHQHLAAASSVPVVALATRDPSRWHGSPWRPGQVARFYYDEFPDRISDVIEAARDPKRREANPRIVHAWTGKPFYLQTDDETRRMAVAQQSWELEYETRRWIPAEFSEPYQKRDARSIGDPHRLPFVHDVINHGMRYASTPWDVIAVTNADVGFAPGLTGRILDVVGRHGAAYAHRFDFARIDAPLVHDGQLKAGTWYAGSDGFFFTRTWWDTYRGELGDYVWGREHWDEALRQLIKLHGGREIRPALYHERHDSFWEDPEHRETLPGNAHNKAEIEKWFSETGLQSEDFRWWQANEVECQTS